MYFYFEMPMNGLEDSTDVIHSPDNLRDLAEGHRRIFVRKEKHWGITVSLISHEFPFVKN